MSDPSKIEPKKRGKKPGSPKTGGRQKGVLNRNQPNIRIAFDDAGLNVIEEYLRLYKQLPEEQKLSEIKFVFKYLFSPLAEVLALPEPKRDSPLSLVSAEKKIASI